MKLQPYIDFWASETEMDSSGPACVLLCVLSVSLNPLVLRLAAAAVTKGRAAIFLWCPSFPPSRSPYATLFFFSLHILECQCATC